MLRQQGQLREIPAAHLDVIICKIPKKCSNPTDYAAIVLNYREHHFRFNDEYLKAKDGTETLKLNRMARDGKFSITDLADPAFRTELDVRKLGLDPKHNYKTAEDIREVLHNKIVLQAGENVSYQDTSIYFQLKEGFSKLTLWFDCLFKFGTLGVFVPIMVPCYEGRGFEWDEAQICSDVNLESSFDLYSFSGVRNKLEIEGDRIIEQCRFVLILIMELKYNEDSIDITEKAFTLFPVWTPNEAIIQGTFQLPLFPDELEMGLLEEIKRADPMKFLHGSSKLSAKGEIKTEKGTVVLRAVPDLLEPFLSEPYDVMLNNTGYLPDKKPSYTPLTKDTLIQELEKVGTGELAEVFPEDYDPDAITDHLKEYLMHNFGEKGSNKGEDRLERKMSVMKR